MSLQNSQNKLFVFISASPKQEAVCCSGHCKSQWMQINWKDTRSAQ